MIDVRDLTFKYPGRDEPAVSGVSFAIERGEIFGFLGPSGAGKSTTQKILTGLLRGYQGSTKVLGKDLNAWGADYYERVGVVFELPNHFRKLTAMENLQFFRSLYSRDTEDPHRLLEMVGLAEDADIRVSAFSKGMQIRLGFVRALLHRPDLLFLDEPTAGLDPANAHGIRSIVRDLAREGHTIFLTTHDMTLADQLCDRVAFIVDGRISLVESPRQLKIRHGERLVRVEYRHDGRSEHRDFPLDALGSNPEFLILLRGERVETIHSMEASLEDVFLQVTGRSLA